MTRADRDHRTYTGVYALYIHVPFCRIRCTYCAFNTYAGQEDLINDYVAALVKEIYLAPPPDQKLRVATLYFGGGTPSLLASHHIETILAAVQKRFEIEAAFEVTLEANPGTIDRTKLQALHALGITRLSLGMQSAHQSELTLFGRLHQHKDVVQAVEDARQAGFDNINLDLIYGVPHQSRQMWHASLRQALALQPDHLSLYALGLEAGTEMTRQVEYGDLPLPDPDLAADMYDDATDILGDAGFAQYEISNWSLAGKQCQHNLQYWRNLPYLGLGAGAHGYANQTRTVNAMRPEIYVQRLESAPQAALPFPCTPATIQAETLDRETDMGETLFMSLRLLQEGLALDEFAARYGEQVEVRFEQEIARLLQKNLVTIEGNRLRLTREARLISNYVFQHFVGTEETA